MTARTVVDRPLVVLAGFMGSGKSTVGTALAERLSVDFVDTDTEIERRAGRTIPEIFTADGEDGFRAIEADTVRDVLASARGVVALGGGSPTVAAIRDALAGCHVVYLEISADDGFARVAGTNRPLLADDRPDERYRTILAARVEHYRGVATHIVDAAQPVTTVVADIISRLDQEKS
ncbi:shikimate kinase [Gordonia liuliyuniae]|uniref:Shikimate kinase n=1 Tax=Gordonia liuliyuniae TaxID=2911517 RepID=A0ABS9IR25_9ACTN|nr:shikimate kinase [Gordonia liuliyuniae]MCF8588013.1 shikimate kinase [Gordonia liuliyuniae]